MVQFATPRAYARSSPARIFPPPLAFLPVVDFLPPCSLLALVTRFCRFIRSFVRSLTHSRRAERKALSANAMREKESGARNYPVQDSRRASTSRFGRVGSCNGSICGIPRSPNSHLRPMLCPLFVSGTSRLLYAALFSPLAPSCSCPLSCIFLHSSVTEHRRLISKDHVPA